jgi:hypothetical protein
MNWDICDGCIHSKYEKDTNATYCNRDMDEPVANEEGDITCEAYDNGEGDVDGDAIRNGD